MTQEIQETEWKEFFDSLSRDMASWQTTVRVLNETTGVQVLSDGLPFAGLTLENKDGNGAIELAIGHGTYDHHYHNIYEPVKIAFEPSGSKAGTLNILDASGTNTLITFVQPMPALMKYPAGELLTVQ